MDTWMLYFAKVNGLIIAFYAMYWLFLKNETFFKSNRWYLILGLVSSFILPFITFTKTIWIEPKPVEFTQLTNYNPVVIHHTTATETPLNWSEILLAMYLLVALLIMIKIGFEIISFYKNIKNQHRIKETNFTLIHTSKMDNPFSFFNYIVLNQKQFSEEELNHIIIHESIHVKQKHSIDVLFSRMICALLWINPVVWLYRKAIIQNLEFIADRETFQTLNNKHAYQKTLLKVVINNNQLAVANHFFQSLIKKRIVMLNTHPSHKNKSWKFAIVVPFIVAFTLLFQIRTIAQEKEIKPGSEITMISSGYSSILTKKLLTNKSKNWKNHLQMKSIN
jgi:beta-lactamase regulating signal transducer with metallopeptidase domain